MAWFWTTWGLFNFFLPKEQLLDEAPVVEFVFRGGIVVEDGVHVLIEILGYMSIDYDSAFGDGSEEVVLCEGAGVEEIEKLEGFE